MLLAVLIVLIVILMVVKPASDRPLALSRGRARGTIAERHPQEEPPMPTVAGSSADLIAHLAGIAHLDGDRLVVDDVARFRDRAAATSPGRPRSPRTTPTVEAARWIVWEASQALGARSAASTSLYVARGRGEVHGFTVPAINIRAQTFDMARTFYETAEPGTSAR